MPSAEPADGAACARRVAVLSDVHGNAVALEAVLAEVAAADVDVVVFGGDLTWGSLPRETVALARALERALYVRGNAERALLEARAAPSAVGLAERERFMAAAHGPVEVAFVETSAQAHVVVVDGLGAVRFCHGSPRSDEECVTPITPAARIEALSAGIAERVLVTAHIHVQFDREVAGVRSVNAGSVGLPYEGRQGAFWALLGPDVDLRRAPYDVERAIAAYLATDDPLREQMAEMLRTPATRDEMVAMAERLEFSG
jgi:predicted phosphodiesterase